MTSTGSRGIHNVLAARPKDSFAGGLVLGGVGSVVGCWVLHSCLGVGCDDFFFVGGGSFGAVGKTFCLGMA